MKALGQFGLVAALAFVSASGGYTLRARETPFDACPPALPQGLLLYYLDTRYSRTCVYHPPAYGRAQHRLEMKRKDRTL